jgi:hypothetical protein
MTDVMEVYLVPTGADRYELYYEAPADAHPDVDDAGRSSWWTRAVARFRALIAEAEEDRRRREDGDPAPRQGLWRAMLRKVAEAIAEQRLLWHLRRATEGRLWFPDDLTGLRATGLLRESLRADFDKHRRWLVIDAVLLLASVPLTVIPGPNVAAWYFTFRVVGHFLSMRGAGRGRDLVTWDSAPSKELSAIPAALRLAHAERVKRLNQLSEALGLTRLSSFIERTRRT